MNGYLTKPFEEETLFSQLLSVFGIQPQYISGMEIPLKTTSSATGSRYLQYDLAQLSELFDNDTSEIIDLIEKFVEYTPEYSSALFTAFEQNDIEKVAKAAHKIKSSLELLASRNLRSNIILIHEYASKKENLEKLPKLIKYYRENIPVLLRQLSEKVLEMKTEPSKP